MRTKLLPNAGEDGKDKNMHLLGVNNCLEVVGKNQTGLAWCAVICRAGTSLVKIAERKQYQLKRTSNTSMCLSVEWHEECWHSDLTMLWSSASYFRSFGFGVAGSGKTMAESKPIRAVPHDI